MAYLHCHDCAWSQDDFWARSGYNPLEEHRISELRADLFQREIRLGGADGEGPEKLTGRAYVVRELGRIIRQIQGMHVLTSEDFDKIKADFVCPKCGSKRWDVD